MRDIQIGGDYDCPKCGQRCSGANVHDCPEERKQTRMTHFMPEHTQEVDCPYCKKRRRIPIANRVYIGDDGNPNICNECRKKREGIIFSKL